MPFHKLSQWLTYSLIEPLEEAGIHVTNLDGLTGLAEYRNGGLFQDLGVVKMRDAAAVDRLHAIGDPLVVEWRALTVALLDNLLPRVREKLKLDKQGFPLGCLLQGGTWNAGRMVAHEKRPNGNPPLIIASDGTVF